MAAGKLGAADLAAAENTLIFAASGAQVFNVRFANRTATSTTVRLAIGTGAAPEPADYVTYDVTLPANGVLEDTGLVASDGEKVWAYSNAASVSVRAHGV